MLQQVIELIGAGAFALLGATAIVGALDRWTRQVTAPVRTGLPECKAVFLFDGGRLVDATPAAWRFLKDAPGRGSDLARLGSRLAQGFGTGLVQQLAALPRAGRLALASPTGAGLLEAEDEGGALRITLLPDSPGGSPVDRLALDAAQAELALLRGLAEDAPQPIWIVDEQGALAWANRAYLILTDIMCPPVPDEAPALVEAGWPSVPLFPVPTGLAEGERRLERLLLTRYEGSEPSCHDVTSVRRGSSTLHFATDVDGLIQAESMRRQFLQTLAKTFAHLRTGLAIFDRERRLIMFNPALVDLTGLPTDFLTARPLVQSVLDRLRDAKILPEPSDYPSWRDAIAALESAAEQGHYCETWTLPDGRTYRVTGRLHPDGALAFLFEDISDEVSLTRHFRAEIGLCRAILDTSEEAMAVFSPDGRLLWSNAACQRLWSASDGGRTGSGCWDEVPWQGNALRSVWDHLHDKAGPTPDGWVDGPLLANGQPSMVWCVALAGHGTLVTFRTTSPS